MKMVGSRRIRPITMHADGALLKEGALFNDELHRLPTGRSVIRIKKGVYRYKSHAEANRHWEECVIEMLVKNTTR